MGAVMKMDGTPLEQRPLPHDIEAEQVLLGSLLLNNDVYSRIAQHVGAEDFYDAVHAELFDTAKIMIEAGKAATPITLKSVVSEIQFAGGMTGGQYLASLCSVAAGPAQVADYAKFIRDMGIQRRAFIACEAAMRRIVERRREDTGPKILDDLETAVNDLRPPLSVSSGFEGFDKAAGRAVDIAARAYQRGGVLAGLSTGLQRLDDALGGLHRSDLIILAGATGMGKSALAINISYAVARGLNERALDGEKTGVVAVFSLEMPADQIAQRILAEHSRISGWRLRKGKVSEGEFSAFSDAASTLRTLPIEIDATGGLTIAQIMTRARALRKRRGIELVVVDYLQLLKGTERRRESSRVQEVAEITAGLKMLAKELDVPVIALSQVARDIGKRDDKRPMLSDLRESGSIEMDADVVLFAFREEYYLKKAEPKPGTEAHAEWGAAMERAHGRADIIIAKNRHGPEDTIRVGFDATLTQFKDELPDDVPPPSRREKGERSKKLTLIKEATVALGILKNLVITASIANEGHVDKAAKGAKLVSYTLWREKCAEELLDSDRGEKAAAALMEKVVKDLRAPASGHAALIGRAGSPEAPFVWVVEAKD